LSEVWAVVGSRGFGNFTEMCMQLQQKIDQYGMPKYIVSGGASGADTLAEQWAALHKMDCVIYEPQWNHHGKKAGAIRNRLIVQAADRVFAFVDGDMTPGTNITINIAKEFGIPYEVFSS